MDRLAWEQIDPWFEVVGEPDGNGGWRRWRGRATAGTLTENEAAVRMHELIGSHDEEQRRLEADADERRRRGVTFRELASEWIVYLEREKGARPSTLRDYRWLLAEPGQALVTAYLLVSDAAIRPSKAAALVLADDPATVGIEIL